MTIFVPWSGDTPVPLPSSLRFGVSFNCKREDERIIKRTGAFQMKVTCFPLSEAHLLFPLSVLTSWKRECHSVAVIWDFFFRLFWIFRQAFTSFCESLLWSSLRHTVVNGSRPFRNSYWKLYFQHQPRILSCVRTSFRFNVQVEPDAAAWEAFVYFGIKNAKMLGRKRENLMKMAKVPTRAIRLEVQHITVALNPSNKRTFSRPDVGWSKHRPPSHWAPVPFHWWPGPFPGQWTW